MTAQELNRYLSQPYARVLVPDPTGGYFAEVLEFPGCFTEGDTADETMANLDEAMLAWIEATLQEGHPIPPPQATQGYSGHVALRLPKSIHREAARRAQIEGTSLNQYLVAAVAARVGADDLVDRLAQRFVSRVWEPLMRTTVVRQTTVEHFRETATTVDLSKIVEQPPAELGEADTSGTAPLLANLFSRTTKEKLQNA